MDTGANSAGKRGLIEIADKGTLFLDEINSMPVILQSKLLRVLETHEVKRIGALKAKAIDFRIIAATNADLDLPREIAAGNHQPLDEIFQFPDMVTRIRLPDDPIGWPRAIAPPFTLIRSIRSSRPSS